MAIRSGNTLLDLYNERTPLYEMYADIIVNEEKKDIRQVVEKILEEMKALGVE